METISKHTLPFAGVEKKTQLLIILFKHIKRQIPQNAQH